MISMIVFFDSIVLLVVYMILLSMMLLSVSGVCMIVFYVCCMCICEKFEYIDLKFVDIIMFDLIVLVVRNVIYDMLLIWLSIRLSLKFSLNR